MPSKNKHEPISLISNAIGLVTLPVMAGWLAGIEQLTKLYFSPLPMAFNTALTFCLYAAALRLLVAGRLQLCRRIALFTALIPSLTLLQYITHSDFGIDALFFTPSAWPSSGIFPGRMAISSCVGAIICGLALACCAQRRKLGMTSAVVLACLASSVITVGLAAIACELASIDVRNVWGQHMRMAVHTALCFVLLGSAVIFAARRQSQRLPLWLPLPVFLSLIAATLTIAETAHLDAKRKVANAVLAEARHAARLIERDIVHLADALNRSAERLETVTVDASAWPQDVAPLLRDFPELRALLWIDASGVVRRVISREGGEMLDGLNLLQIPAVQPTFNAVTLAGNAQVTPVIESPNSILHGSILHLRPIQHVKETSVVIGSLIDLEKIAQNQIDDTILNSTSISITDAGRNIFSTTDSPKPSNEALSAIYWINIYGRTWGVRIQPRDNFMEALSSAGTLPIYTTGGVLTILASVCVMLLLQREGAHQTRHTMSQKALESSHERYNLVVQAMSVGLWDWDLVTNELYWSDRYRQIIGLDNALLVPSPQQFEARLHPDDRERVLAALAAHIQHGSPYALEYRLRKETGEYVWVYATGQAVWDDNRKPLRMAGSINDITRRKLAEARSQQVVDSAPYAMILINKEGRIELANRATAKLFGYSRYELILRNIEDLLPEHLRREHSQHRETYFDSSSSLYPEVRAMAPGRDLLARRKDGSEFPVEIGLIPLQTEEGPMVLSAVIDLTERKKIEEQYRQFNEILEAQVADRTRQLTYANKELEEFAFVASHDLKAPLRVIDNASKWLEEDLEQHLTEDTRENMTLLRGRVKRMERLLDDLLEYSRIGRRADSRTGQEVRGDQLMDDVVGLLSVPRDFTVDVSPAFAQIAVARMPLQQILLNLVGNAIKHHDRPAGRIEVLVEEHSSEYVFVVRDDGPGIPKRFHDEVFKMFYTLKPRDQLEGSGMGLAMVRKYIEVFGGTLHLESGDDRGSTFRFTWPKQTSSQQAAA